MLSEAEGSVISGGWGWSHLGGRHTDLPGMQGCWDGIDVALKAAPCGFCTWELQESQTPCMVSGDSRGMCLKTERQVEGGYIISYFLRSHAGEHCGHLLFKKGIYMLPLDWKGIKELIDMLIKISVSDYVIESTWIRRWPISPCAWNLWVCQDAGLSMITPGNSEEWITYNYFTSKKIKKWGREILNKILTVPVYTRTNELCVMKNYKE